MNKLLGTVNWFDDKRGFGFLSATEVEGDIFVHHEQILMDGFSYLRKGQGVSFELDQSAKGLSAKNVSLTIKELTTFNT